MAFDTLFATTCPEIVSKDKLTNGRQGTPAILRDRSPLILPLCYPSFSDTPAREITLVARFIAH